MARPNAAPAGYTAVTPWIVTTATGQLLDFITAVFDGEVLARLPLEDGSIGHAEIRVGDTVLLAFDRRPGSARSSKTSVPTKECDGWLSPNTPRQ